MDRAGEKLRRVRERLKLTYRDVVEASQAIAKRRGIPDYGISLSRLADIENGGRVPTLYRLYSLCAVYRLDFQDVIRWYKIPVESLAAESLQIGIESTHPLRISPHVRSRNLEPPALEADPAHTTFLSHLSDKAPLSLIYGLEMGQHRYGLIGSEDWSMFPILRPGSLVLIDETRRRIARSGWTNEFDRPIYFLEHRDGFLCGWCALESGRLIVQPHPSSDKFPSIFRYPDEIDVLGQVVGVAMALESKKRRTARLATIPTKSRDLPDKAAVPPHAQMLE